LLEETIGNNAAVPEFRRNEEYKQSFDTEGMLVERGVCLYKWNLRTKAYRSDV